MWNLDLSSKWNLFHFPVLGSMNKLSSGESSWNGLSTFGIINHSTSNGKIDIPDQNQTKQSQSQKYSKDMYLQLTKNYIQKSYRQVSGGSGKVEWGRRRCQLTSPPAASINLGQPSKHTPNIIISWNGTFSTKEKNILLCYIISQHQSWPTL